MKKSLIFFPVFMLLLGGCGTKSETSSSETPVNPTSSVAPAGPSSVAPTSSQGPSVSPDPSSEVPPSSSADPVVNKYTVTWKDGNGTIIETDTDVVEGTMPSYDGATPTKTADASATYEFNGNWVPAVAPVEGNVVYVAQFDATPKQYTITWIDGNGAELKQDSVAYGSTPVYSGDTPTKNDDVSASYAFNGNWSPSIVPVSGDATYVAQFDSTPKQYTITWVDGNGNELQSGKVAYGQTPVYTGATPTKDQTAEKVFSFNGEWEPAIAAVSGDATYTAQFDESPRPYTITWLDGNGDELKSEQVGYGLTPAYVGDDPTKASTAQYNYEWDGGWSPAIHAVSGDETYTATFNNETRQYQIRFLDGDGNVLDTQNVDYGATPSYDGTTPTKSSTVDKTYTWNHGWEPTIAPVSGAQDYVATFNEAVRQYTVRFFNGENLYHSENVAYGSKASGPAVDPTMSDSTYKYTFTGWDFDLSQNITGDTDIHAEYSKLKYFQQIETFEDFEVSNELKDADWYVTYWTSGGWSKENSASLSLSTHAAQGSKALRLNAYRGNGFKILKEFTQDNPNPATDRANTFKFSLKTPTGKAGEGNGQLTAARLILYTDIPNPFGSGDPVWIKRDLPITTSEYADYVIPFAASGWSIYDTPRDLYETGAAAGIDVDSIPVHLTSFEIYLQYATVSPSEYYAFLDDVSWVTTEGNQVEVYQSFQNYSVYTGTTNTGKVFRVDVKGESQDRADIIDNETSMEVQGTVTAYDDVFEFHSSAAGALTLLGKRTDGGQKIKLTAASSSMFPDYDDELENIELNAVQVVDNYEQYTEAGKAYSQIYTEAQREGMRGEYYSEYYTGSGSAPWGLNGWSLMGGSADQMDLNTSESYVHGGSKSIKLKNISGNAMRYLQWGIFKGTSDKNAYRGSTMSFWVKASGTVNNIYLYAFSKADCTTSESSNLSYCKKVQFTDPISTSEWTQLTVALNPNIVYYGFGIMLDKNNVGTSYLYVDDVEVYGANPYAKYEAPTDAELRVGKVYAGKAGGVVNTLLTIKEGNNARLQIPSLLINLPATYSTSLDEVTFSFSGATYVGTVSADGSAITFKSIAGSSAVAQVLNGTSFGESYVCETAEGYSDSGKMYYQSSGEDARSGARGAYFCDYYSGGSGSPVGGSGWSLMGGSGDQLSLNKSAYYEGSQSLDMKFSTNGAMRYLQWDLYKGTAKPITGVSSFTVYAKNISGYDAQINVQVFTTPQVTPSNQGTARVALGDTYIVTGTDWTAYTVTLNPASTYYGFGIVLKAVGSTSGYIRGTGFLQIDGAHYNKADYDYEWSVLPKKDLTLSGTLPIGDASFKFGDPGKGLFNCATASMTDVAATYSMRMNAGVQEMTLTVGETVVVGEYSFDSSTQKVKFTVISATGTYAAAFPVDTVFTN